MKINIDIGIGEAFDRLSILKLKELHCKDKQLRKVLLKQIGTLTQKLIELGIEPWQHELYKKLASTNKRLWELEDQIRITVPVEIVHKMATAIIMTNDTRSELKGRIDDHFESEVFEVKQYNE